MYTPWNRFIIPLARTMSEAHTHFTRPMDQTRSTQSVLQILFLPPPQHHDTPPALYTPPGTQYPGAVWLFTNNRKKRNLQPPKHCTENSANITTSSAQLTPYDFVLVTSKMTTILATNKQ